VRKNPTITTSSKNLRTVADGIDNLPIPSGKNMTVQEEGNAMPDVSMSKNDGDNPSIPDAPFANGKDKREPDNQGGANPWPAKPGC
jgi:hypothetical protein